ncbi:M20/M25/M40 family metallo-hydrolase, partial [Planctomycetota bacterium]|nr:M20/M25/M40 family metallo-hydrolase [Planctomycetota bacterium]
ASHAATQAEGMIPQALERLGDYVAVPALSRDSELFPEVRRMAELAACDLKEAGLDNVQVLDLEGALPCVRGEKIVNPGGPTVLIYGHFDQQPADPAVWDTDPHVMTKKGDRLYGRGVADDLGGWLSQLVAFKAWQAAGGVPLNVRFLLEGEEEIGSPRLGDFMSAYPEAFQADVMVLTDCDNPATDQAGLTVCLRGMLEVDITVRALQGKVHSGLWGGALPDPSMAICKILADLVDDNGRVAGLDAPVPDAWRESVAGLSPDDDALRADAGMLPDAVGLDPGGRPRVEWMWRQPHVTVVATNIPHYGQEANVILPHAKARLSVRLAPGQTPEDVFEHLKARVEAKRPFGLPGDVEKGIGTAGWLYEAEGPAFDAAGRAYAKAFGKPLVKIGVGGSIPFITLFAERFPDTPLILNGVMDPRTGAHGPNESLHVGLFEKVVLANVYLLGELAETFKA